MAPLYGRLKGMGKEKTATATDEITATVETWEGKVSVTLFASGRFVVEVGEKHGIGRPVYEGNANGTPDTVAEAAEGYGERDCWRCDRGKVYVAPDPLRGTPGRWTDCSECSGTGRARVFLYPKPRGRRSR